MVSTELLSSVPEPKDVPMFSQDTGVFDGFHGFSELFAWVSMDFPLFLPRTRWKSCKRSPSWATSERFTLSKSEAPLALSSLLVARIAAATGSIASPSLKRDLRDLSDKELALL